MTVMCEAEFRSSEALLNISIAYSRRRVVFLTKISLIMLKLAVELFNLS